MSLCYRFGLGYYIAVRAEYVLSTLIALAFSMFYLMYMFLNLPFKQAYQNYRTCFCHIAHLIILFVGNYYDSMLANQPWSKKGYLFTAAQLQIIAIYASVGFSACCLLYDCYTFIKDLLCQKSFKTKPSRKISRDILNPTEIDLTKA